MNRALKAVLVMAAAAVFTFAMLVVAARLWAMPTPLEPAAATSVSAPRPVPVAPVVSVTDGDTFRALLAPEDPDSTPVRILGIDTPELRGDECYSHEARAKLTDLLTNQQVVLTQDPGQPDRDRYDRALRYVMLPDGTDAGLFLVRYGYAVVYTEFPVSRTAEYLQAQVLAQEEGRGLWTDSRR